MASVTNTFGNMQKKAINSLSTQAFFTFAIGVIEILVFSIMSRLLTEEDFGYYAAISAIYFVYSSFSETGIGAAIIQNKDINKEYINNAFTLSLVFGSFLSLLMMTMSGFVSEIVVDSSITIPLMLMSLTLLFNSLTSVNISLLYRNLQFKRAGTASVLALAIASALSIIMAIEGFGYYAIMAKFIGTSVLTWLFSVIFVKTRYSCTIDIAICKSIFNFSGWLMASVVCRNISQQIDRLLMPKLLNVTLLGSYNRPKDFVMQIATKLNGVFDTALFPVLSSIQDKTKSLQNAFFKAFYLINLFSTLLGVTFIFNSELIIRIFLGDQWLHLRSIFCLFSFAMIFNADGRLADCYLRSLGLTKHQFYFRVAETLLKTLSVLIGYKGGILGVALSIVIADIITKVAKILYVSFKIDIQICKVLIQLYRSWQFCCYLVPFSIISNFFFSNTIEGNIIYFVIYFVFSILLFVFTPKLVGSIYYQDYYYKVISIVQLKIKEHSCKS